MQFHAHLHVRHTRGREIIISWQDMSLFIFLSVLQAACNSWGFNYLTLKRILSVGDVHVQNCGHQVADIYKNEHQVHAWKENNILRLLNWRHSITINWKAVPWTLMCILWASVKMGFIYCNERAYYKFILWKSNAPCMQEVLLGGGSSWATWLPLYLDK